MSKPINLPSLTGVRALAAFWVMALHLNPQIFGFFPAIEPYLPFVMKGYLGVDLFFVLSGFIIAHNYWNRLFPITKQGYFNYLWARLARVYPVHLFMLFSVLFLITAAKVMGFSINRPSDYQLGSFIEHIFLINAWAIPAQVSWNHFAWSVSAEFFAYILTPVFFWLTFKKLNSKAMLCLMMGAFLAISPLAVYFWPQDTRTAYALFRIVGGFGAGVIAYRFYRDGWGKDWNWNLLTNLSLIAILVGTSVMLPFKDVVDFICVPLFVLFIYALSWQKGTVSRILSNRFFDYWGRVSYSLYMTQFVIIMPLKKLLPHEQFFESSVLVKLGVIGLYVVLMLISAVLTYHVVEEPARNLMKRFNPLATRK